MASINDNLKILETKLDAAKTKLASNLTEKGVASDISDTLDVMANKVATIPSGGGGGLDWGAIGYEKQPSFIEEGFDYAKQIYDTWDPSITICTYSGNKNLTYFPLVDTSNVTNMSYMFHNSSVTHIPSLNTSKVTNFYSWCSSCENLISVDPIDFSSATKTYGLFYCCEKLKYIPHLNTTKSTDFSYCFFQCRSLTEISVDITNGTNFKNMINYGDSLEKIKIVGCTTQSITTTEMFGDPSFIHTCLKENGVLIYDHRYGNTAQYQQIFRALRDANPTWTTKPDDQV